MATVNVYGELNCAEVDGKLARADQIYDYDKGKYQSEINDSMLTASKSDIEEAIQQLEVTLAELQAAEASAVSDAEADITVAKNAAIEEIEEVVQTVDITYETISGENVQLKNGGGDNLFPRTKDYFLETMPSKVARTINSSNKWVSDSSGSNGYLKPVAMIRGMTMRINAPSGCQYAFLTAAPSLNSAVSYCTGTSLMRGQETIVVTIPSDCAYLYVYTLGFANLLKVNDGMLYSDYLSGHQQVLTSELKTTMLDNLGMTVQFAMPAKAARVINSSNKWVPDSGGSYCYFVNTALAATPLAGKTVVIKTTAVMQVAFLSAIPTMNQVVSYCTGTSLTKCYGGVTLTVPQDCVRLYIYTGGVATLSYVQAQVLPSQTIYIDDDNSVSAKGVALNATTKIAYDYCDHNIGSTDKWVTSANPYGALIDVSGIRGKIVSIKTNSASRISFFNAEPVDNAVVSYCTGYYNQPVLAGNTWLRVVPVDAIYLYIYAVNKADVVVNVSQELKNLVDNEVENPYRLVYDENFKDESWREMWGACNFQSPNYASEFLSDDNNLYRESDCLVLRLQKRGTKYYAPYISTAKTLAVKRGKAECRMKYSTNNGHIGGCFWAWGQSGSWPKTVEYDVYEKIIGQSYIKCHTHYKSGGTSTEQSYDQRSFDTDWHILGVEWDENGFQYYFDGEKMVDVAASSLNPDGTWDFPQIFALNLKCNSSYNTGDATLMVDYVRVWTKDDKEALLDIAQDDVAMNVGDSTYINPVFSPTFASNQAFTMTSSNSAVVEVHSFISDYENHMPQHKITAVAAGSAVITITSANGKVSTTFNVQVS